MCMECTEAIAKSDCGKTESLENPTGARERRNVLKVGHSLREGKKCLCKAGFGCYLDVWGIRE